MKKYYIITWGKESELDKYELDDVFNCEEDAQKVIDEELSDDDTKYVIREVSEVFLYLVDYLTWNEIQSFSDDEDDLKEIYDFFENVRDERLIKKYLREALYGEFYTLNRKKFIQREIENLKGML